MSHGTRGTCNPDCGGYSLCHCGCGATTNVATFNRASGSIVRGHHYIFTHGHGNRRWANDIVRDRAWRSANRDRVRLHHRRYYVRQRSQEREIRRQLLTAEPILEALAESPRSIKWLVTAYADRFDLTFAAADMELRRMRNRGWVTLAQADRWTTFLDIPLDALEVAA